MKHAIILLSLITILCAVSATAGATVYNVGPGQAYTNIIDVPLESLVAGDTVNIYYKATPYYEKVIASGVGTASQPITFHGVPGPGGALPIIDGQNAVSRLALSWGSEARGLICMQQGDATTIPPTRNSAYITIENLEIRNASQPYTFTDDDGVTQAFTANAAGIWSVNGYNVTVRNCYIHDCGNGIMTYCQDTGTVNWTQDWLIEGNYVNACGNAGSNQEHDTYCETYRITYQYNRYGPPRGGDTQAIGNALKDRSAGMVVRYNWIEGGNRCIDAIDCEDSSTLGVSPEWDKSYMYGNILIERPDIGNRQVVNFGKDMHAEPRHKGYFYNNTVVSYRGSATETRTTVIRNTSTGFVDVRNCVIYSTAAAGNQIEITNDSSKTYPINIRNCWLKPGYVLAGPSGGLVNDYGGHVLGTDPGFVNFSTQDFHILPSSGCVNAGTTLHADAASYPVDRQYVKNQSSEARPSDGTLDIGAFEASSALAIVTSSLPSGTVSGAYSATLQAAGGTAPYTWGIQTGSLPTGLSLNASTGAIVGTPSVSGTSNFTAIVQDAVTATATKALSIVINPVAPLSITTASLPDAHKGQAYSQTLTATGGVTPYTWSVMAGSLPAGLSLAGSTGVISGTPTVSGTSNFTTKVTDSQATTASKALSLVVQRR